MELMAHNFTFRVALLVMICPPLHLSSVMIYVYMYIFHEWLGNEKLNCVGVNRGEQKGNRRGVL